MLLETLAATPRCDGSPSCTDIPNPKPHRIMPAKTRPGWYLWIDAVAGFWLIDGTTFVVGGSSGEEVADIAVRSSWRPREATLTRCGDTFEVSSQKSSGDSAFVKYNEPIDLNVGPCLRMIKPSPLSRSVVVSVDPPHRFVKPVDAIILFDQSILIGPNGAQHIRCPAATGSMVLFYRGGQWSVRASGGEIIAINDGVCNEIDNVVMTMKREGGKLPSGPPGDTQNDASQ